MGISGLIPFLKNATRDVHIREFKGWLSLKFQVTYHKMRIQGAPPPRVGFYEGEAGAQESFLRSEPVGFRGSAPPPVSEMFGFQWVVWPKRVLKKFKSAPWTSSWICTCLHIRKGVARVTSVPWNQFSDQYFGRYRLLSIVVICTYLYILFFFIHSPYI